MKKTLLRKTPLFLLALVANFALSQEDESVLDSDFDGIPDEEEIIIGTDPFNPDSDGDFLEDGEEFYFLNTDPTVGMPVKHSQTRNPYLFGFDWQSVPYSQDFQFWIVFGDGLSFAEDIDRQTHYQLIFGYDQQTSGGLSHTLATTAHSIEADQDQDGIPDELEIMLGTSPIYKDSDGDSISDHAELTVTLTHPLYFDTDGDTFSDSIEFAQGSNPRIFDESWESDQASDATDQASGSDSFAEGEWTVSISGVSEMSSDDLFEESGELSEKIRKETATEEEKERFREIQRELAARQLSGSYEPELTPSGYTPEIPDLDPENEEELTPEDVVELEEIDIWRLFLLIYDELVERERDLEEEEESDESEEEEFEELKKAHEIILIEILERELDKTGYKRDTLWGKLNRGRLWEAAKNKLRLRLNGRFKNPGTKMRHDIGLGGGFGQRIGGEIGVPNGPRPRVPSSAGKPPPGGITPPKTIPKSGPGSTQHRDKRWKEYQERKEREGKKPMKRKSWDRVYDANMKNAKNGNAARDRYRDKLGWGDKEVEVDTPSGKKRKLDIADKEKKKAVEVKSSKSKTYKSAEIESEARRDKELKDDGWEIEWRFEEGDASQPLRDLLNELGIPFSFGNPNITVIIHEGTGTDYVDGGFADVVSFEVTVSHPDGHGYDELEVTVIEGDDGSTYSYVSDSNSIDNSDPTSESGMEESYEDYSIEELETSSDYEIETNETEPETNEVEESEISYEDGSAETEMGYESETVETESETYEVEAPVGYESETIETEPETYDLEESEIIYEEENAETEMGHESETIDAEPETYEVEGSEIGFVADSAEAGMEYESEIIEAVDEYYSGAYDYDVAVEGP